MKWFTVLLFWLLSISLLVGQNCPYVSIDSLINKKSIRPFNGVILIHRKGKVVYSSQKGYSDIEKKIALSDNDRFVIGSVSKQITAVMILKEFEKGRVELDKPIKNYLPELTQGWADSVTIHDLLCHTHGIVDMNKPSVFPNGEKFLYSQIGYKLLADILEHLNHKSFLDQSDSLFRSVGMNNTFHPDSKSSLNLVKSYREDNGSIVEEKENTKDVIVAAGGFISTVQDLFIWNEALFGDKLLRKETLDLMVTKQSNAVRNHPIFGQLHYGGGITVDTSENLIQLGQTGYIPGFVSMDFYFPEYETGVIVLENIDYDTDNIKKTFFYHTCILDLVRNSLIEN